MDDCLKILNAGRKVPYKWDDRLAKAAQMECDNLNKGIGKVHDGMEQRLKAVAFPINNIGPPDHRRGMPGNYSEGWDGSVVNTLQDACSEWLRTMAQMPKGEAHRVDWEASYNLVGCGFSLKGPRQHFNNFVIMYGYLKEPEPKPEPDFTSY